VKVNYGIRPDGSKDFPELPADWHEISARASFGRTKMYQIPGKIQIYCFVLDGERVDGFRYDMAEMVPYNLELHEFYNKIANKDAFFDEVYNPAEYRIIFD
jgi:hypothetical protein